MLHCLRQFKRTNNILNFPICHSVVTCYRKFNYLYGERFKLLTMPDPIPTDPRTGGKNLVEEKPLVQETDEKPNDDEQSENQEED